jgi:hypothetical protein
VPASLQFFDVEVPVPIPSHRRRKPRFKRNLRALHSLRPQPSPRGIAEKTQIDVCFGPIRSFEAHPGGPTRTGSSSTRSSWRPPRCHARNSMWPSYAARNRLPSSHPHRRWRGPTDCRRFLASWRGAENTTERLADERMAPQSRLVGLHDGRTACDRKLPGERRPCHGRGRLRRTQSDTSVRFYARVSTRIL